MEQLGIVLMVIGGIWLIWLAFSEGILWGLGCLLIPFVSLFYAATRWPETRSPSLVWAAGLALFLLGR